MASVKVSVEGAEEIDRQLGRLPIELRERTLKKALNRAGTIGVREARNRVDPSVTGGDPEFAPLKKQINKRAMKSRELKSGEVGTVVRVVSRHAHLVEYGHRAVLGGTIASGSPARIRKAKDPERTGKGRVIGFVEPHPFFRPGQIAAGPQIDREVISAVDKYIEKENSK